MVIPVFVWTPLGLVFLLALFPAATFARALPAGFEDLADGHAERVEVRAFGRSAGTWPAWVTLDHVRLEQPAQVMAALALGDDAQQALQAAIAQPLARDSHLACAHVQPQPGCGWRIPPDDVSQLWAIFDEAEGVLLLFPSVHWLPTTEPAARIHRLSDDAENALLLRHVVSVSGSGGEQALNAHGTAALGVGRAGHLAAGWNGSRLAGSGTRTRHRWQTDELYYRHDLAARHYLQVGRMDRRHLASAQGGQFGLGLLPLERFDGVRVGTTQAYVDTESQAEAVPVSVLLGRDARVDVFDGERLLQTYYLPAGVNVLDTRAFPPGAYLLTLRIHEDGHYVRSEQAPFQRSLDGAEGGLQWFAQGGRQYGIGADAVPGLQAGMRLPLGHGASLRGGLARSNGTGYHELRLGTRRRLWTHDLHLELGTLAATDGSHGGQLQLSLRRRASWNLYRQQMRGGTCRRLPRMTHDRVGCSDARSASLSLPVGNGNLYLGHTRRRSHGVAADATHTARSLQASFSRTRQWRGFSVGTRLGMWRQRGGVDRADVRDHGLQLGLSLSRLQRTDNASRLQRVGWERRQGGHGTGAQRLGLMQSWRQETQRGARELNAELGAQREGHLDGLLGARLQAPWGQGGAVLSMTRTRGDTRLAYSGTHGAGVAVSRRGVYWGAADAADAGVAVQVEPAQARALQGVVAEIQAGGHRRQALRVGERRLLPLSGYQRHRVDVQDASAPGPGGAVRVEAARLDPPFLSPGRLLVLPIAVDASVTYLGHARGPGGQPLSGARVLNAAVPPLDAEGRFTAEFPKHQSVLYLLHDNALLQCPLQVRHQRSVLQVVGAVACTPLSRGALPAELGSQPRVQRLLQDAAPLAVQPPRTLAR